MIEVIIETIGVVEITMGKSIDRRKENQNLKLCWGEERLTFQCRRRMGSWARIQTRNANQVGRE